MKYCPSCGKQNNDLLQSCWNCGQYIGRGRVRELESIDSANEVASNLNLEKRNIPTNNQYINRDETNVGLVTIYGVTKGDLQHLLEKNEIIADFTEMPNLCTSDEMLTQGELRRQEQGITNNQKVNSGYNNDYYYYSDPTGDICCYYACMPRRRYHSYSSHTSSSCCNSSSGSSSGGCDCDDNGSDNDAFAIIAVILLVIALIALLFIAGPALATAGLVILDIAISLVLLLFNFLTLGIYKDDLSRHRIRIRQAKPENLDNLLQDLLDKRGLPKMPGYWTVGFTMIRYGAIFFMVGLLFVLLMFGLQPAEKKLYTIPASLIVFSLITFFSGHFLINKKINELKFRIRQ